jgi:type I restriction enzyme, S subunit
VDKYRLASGDIVFARIGATTGKSYLITEPPPSVFASYLIRVRARCGIDPAFLSKFFHSDAYWRQVNAQKNANLKKGVSGSLLKTLVVPTPPLPEQRKIAAVLGLVQRAIEQQERLIALTTELKKALLHKLFTEGVRGEPQKQTEIGPVPESWEVVELSNAVEQIDYGISAPIPKTPPENGVKIVSTADITKDGRLLYAKIRRIEAPEKTVKRLTLQTGDVLFNWRNSAELIGKSAVFQEQIEPHVFASFILRIKCGERKSHNFFLAHLMNHFRQTSVFLKLARRAVNQANYNRNEISVLKIPLPTYQEQREIADAIAAVDSKIQHHRQKKSKLEDLFRTLLHRLMTAQIRIHDRDLPELEQELQ